jgi:hypothetical protein
MSVWTHVVGCIRLDGFPPESRVEDVKRTLGPMCLWNKWDDSSRLPRGSEGSLQYRVIEYFTGIPWVVVPIWGDLRDYSDVEAIRGWWGGLLRDIDDEKKSRDFSLRDAILAVQVEGRPTVVMTAPEEPEMCGDERP